MEKVSLTLQNRELIEEIVKNNPDIETKIHTSIIDGISKRIAKVVVGGELTKLIDQESKKAEKELLKHYFTEEDSRFGYGKVFKLKSEYWETMKEKIVSVVNDTISETVKHAIDERLAEKIDEISNFDFNTAIKEAIEKEVQRRFS